MSFLVWIWIFVVGHAAAFQRTFFALNKNRNNSFLPTKRSIMTKTYASNAPMDCCCCADPAKMRSSNSEFLRAICDVKEGDAADAKFPAEANRYLLYVIAGCPFAARPWIIQAIYGLPVQVVKLFPASADQGWFFSPTSDKEQTLVDGFPSAVIDSDPLHGSDHLKQLYLKANSSFDGAISVPLLWDKKADTAVSNSSLDGARMLATQMKDFRTRNVDLELFPDSSEHENLIEWIHTKITTKVYKIHASKKGTEHDAMVDEYYSSLRELVDTRLSKTKYLMGDKLCFADVLLFISLLRLDLAYQWRFGLGKYSIREDFPRLQEFVQDALKIEGVSETIYPRDIMALYFMTWKWTENGNGLTLPQVPHAWESKLTP
jgi:glutathionyl-hydroquinone reductase